ncbi:MAG: gamma carbonic anhydrase family protein [Phycisphaerales bacterium]|nr:gamma carbonic anhydrase family protein [Phycisphaerales bacterium]MCB9862418.1 gamma carbonic anhydrase family protein [Phycisphaerales bacterium]
MIAAMIIENASVTLGRDCYIAPTAYVGGAVTLGDETTVMHHVVIRGDVSNIRIGARVNVQDGTVIHTTAGVDLDIGDDVSIGHRAIVHCKRIGSNSLIGMGSIVLDGCTIGQRCIIGAGAVVPPNFDVPDGKVVMGVPGRIVRDIREDEYAYLDYVVENYRKLGKRHRAGEYANVAPNE